MKKSFILIALLASTLTLGGTFFEGKLQLSSKDAQCLPQKEDPKLIDNPIFRGKLQLSSEDAQLLAQKLEQKLDEDLG